jgi:hypothetical protein
MQAATGASQTGSSPPTGYPKPATRALSATTSFWKKSASESGRGRIVGPWPLATECPAANGSSSLTTTWHNMSRNDARRLEPLRTALLRSVIPKERSGVGRRLRHRGSPVLLARCHISSIGLASVSRQVCGRHSLTPSGLPARAGGPGRRGCRIRSRPVQPVRRRETAGRGRRRLCGEPTRVRQVQDRCPGSGG